MTVSDLQASVSDTVMATKDALADQPELDETLAAAACRELTERRSFRVFVCLGRQSAR